MEIAIQTSSMYNLYHLGAYKYSRVPLMWPPKGRVKSVHICEPSTVVDTLSCGHLE